MLDNPDFFKNLTEEDVQSLEKMFKKMLETTVDPEILEQKSMEQSANQYAGLFAENESLVDSPVELIFTISCNVLNKNQKGEVENSEKVIVKTYHVPLDNKQQVERYVEGFFNKFHDKIEQQADETFDEPRDE